MTVDWHCVDQLFDALEDKVTEAEVGKDGAVMMRYAVAMMELGLKALKHDKGDDLDPTLPRTQLLLYQRAFSGSLCCAQAQKRIRTAIALTPSDANRVLAERYAQVENYWRAWEAAVTSTYETKPEQKQP